VDEVINQLRKQIETYGPGTAIAKDTPEFDV
jgi:hypothetical protein